METKHTTLKLTEIRVSKSNEMFRDEHELTELALKELIDSIKEHGVIQPILVRPAGKSYELVCGERRFRATRYAALVNIPATIRELTDDEAFALQVTENLQRKDVHPLREAHAYQYLVDKDPKANTIPELALRFGKTEHYVATRLKLNDLIPEAKKDFSDGIMTLGHALLIARLTPADQKAAMSRCVDQYLRDKQRIRVYGTVAELENHINDDVICVLDAAAFKKDDAALVPKAGPCTTCAKRSGANQLFSDVKEKDRCFDRVCFLAKRMAFMITQLPTLLEKEPDLAYLIHHQDKKVDPRVDKILHDHKVKILVHNTDYRSWGHVKIKGIFINGDEVGRRVTVFSTHNKPASQKASPEKLDAKEAIARINERIERGRELDEEKIFSTIVGLLPGRKEFEETNENPTIAGRAAITLMVYNHADFRSREAINKKLGWGKIKWSDRLRFLKELPASKLAWMARTILVNQYSSVHLHNKSEGLLLEEIARECNIDVDETRQNQLELRKVREDRAAKRKKELQAASKPKKGLKDLIGKK